MLALLSKWQARGIVGALGALLFVATWLHGHHKGVVATRTACTAEQAQAQTELQKQHDAAMKVAEDNQRQQAELAARLLKDAQDREQAEIERRVRLTREVNYLRHWREQQMAESADCAAWADAPVGCRLRAPAAVPAAPSG